MKAIATALFAITSLPLAVCAENPVVVMKTNHGEITIELDKEKAPITVENFVAYLEKGHYDGTIFHRVIDDFMIQGGGFAKGEVPEQKRTAPPIKNEASNGLSNERGTIAMARRGDPHSATSQFFINVANNKNLNPGGVSPDGYAVFGKVTEGMEVVDAIKAVATGSRPLKLRHGMKLQERETRDVPLEPVIIESIRLKTADAAKPE